MNNVRRLIGSNWLGRVGLLRGIRHVSVSKLCTHKGKGISNFTPALYWFYTGNIKRALYSNKSTLRQIQYTLHSKTYASDTRDRIEVNQILGSFPNSGKWSLKGVNISFSGKMDRIPEKSSIPAGRDGAKAGMASGVEDRKELSGIQCGNVHEWDCTGCTWWSRVTTIALDSSSKTFAARDRKWRKIVRTWIIGRLAVSILVKQSAIVVISLKSSVSDVATTLQNSTKYAVIG